MAAASLGRLTLDLLVRLGSFEQGLNRAERQASQSASNMSDAFRGFGDQIRESLGGTQLGSLIGDVTTRLEGMQGSVLVATAGLAGLAAGGTVLAVAGLSKMAIETAKADSEMAMLANRAQIGIENFQIMTVASQQLGISQDQLGSIFADVQEKLGEFSATGGGGAADFFDALKNNTKLTDDQIKAFSKTLQGKDGVEAVQMLKDKLDDLGASSQEQRFVFESLASDLTNLMPLFSEGGARVEEYGKALQDAGVIKSKEAIQQSQILAAQTQAVNLQFQGAKTQLITGFMPALVNVADAMFGTSKNGVQLQEVGDGLGTVFKGVAHAAIATATGVKFLANGLAGMAAIGAKISENMKWYEVNPLGFAKAAFQARTEIAALSADINANSSAMVLDAADSLDRLWAKTGERKSTTNTLTNAILQLNQAQNLATTGLKINTKEADENAKAAEKQAVAKAKLNKELQVNAKVQANADKFGFASLESQYKLPNGLLSAINMQESRGNANAIGPMTKYGTAKGGFQFLDGTAKRFGLIGNAVFDTGKSAEAAAKYFQFLYQKFGTWEKAISAYHAGEGNVERGTGLGPINREYVKNVLGYMDAALKGVGTTAADAVKYVEEVYKSQQSIVLKYLNEQERMELEHSVSIQEIKDAFAENDPSREKYLKLQQLAYQKDVAEFKKAQEEKRQAAFSTINNPIGDMVGVGVNARARASLSSGEYDLWSMNSSQQDGYSQLADNLYSARSGIENNEYLSETERYQQLTDAYRIYLDSKKALTEEYSKQEKDYAQYQYENQLNIYDSLLSQAGTVWGSMTQMVKDSAGEQSGAYKAMFLMQQAIAIGQAIISTELAATRALELGPILGIPASTLVRGMGYASVGLIAAQTIQGMAHNGIDNIPKEGTWLLDGGERVLNPEQNKDLTRYLNGRQGGDGVNVNINVPPGYTANESRDANGNVTIDVVEKMIKKSWTNVGQPNSFESKQVQRNFNTSVKR